MTWEARQGSTEPQQSHWHLEPQQGLGQLSTGGLLSTAAQGCRCHHTESITALREGRDEVIRTQMWPHSHWETPTDAVHRCSRASLFLHHYTDLLPARCLTAQLTQTKSPLS